VVQEGTGTWSDDGACGKRERLSFFPVGGCDSRCEAAESVILGVINRGGSCTWVSLNGDLYFVRFDGFRIMAFRMS
jgi:hypothetical protein